MRRLLTYVFVSLVLMSAFPNPAAACIACGVGDQLDSIAFEIDAVTVELGDIDVQFVGFATPPPPPTPRPTPRPVVPKPRPVTKVTGGSGRCYAEPGTPPEHILMRESGGNPTVWNRQGSSASGCWQIIRGTWNNYRGYPNAASAPISVQNAKAKELWAGGAGCSHWSACG